MMKKIIHSHRETAPSLALAGLSAGHAAPAPLALRPGALLLGSPRTLPESGAMGFSYALGRDGRKARLAAITDALLQSEIETGPLRRGVFALAQQQQAARELASRKAAATKVDFFTLVRGG